MVSTLASSRRAMVSSRRCCCVLAMSGKSFRGLAGAGPKEATRLQCRAVALTELAVAVHDGPANARGNDRRVVAIDHPRQPAVERDLFLVIAVDRFVEACRVDHDEVRAFTFAQRARVEAEPLGGLGGAAVRRPP